MFIANREDLTNDLLMRFISTFKMEELPRLERLGRYYDNKHDILQRTMSDSSKPNNRVVNPFPQYITDMYTGYFMGEPVSYKVREEFQDELDQLKMVLTYNDEQDENSQLAQMASVYGKAYEIIYIDRDGNLRFKALSPVETFTIHDDSIEHDVTFAVRWYAHSNKDGNDKSYKVEVYDDKMVMIYSTTDLFKSLSLIDSYPHGFNSVPIAIFLNDDNENGDFESVIPLVDAYDKLTSDALNDQEAFTDAYLVFTGVDVENEDINLMKENRVITLPEGATAQWLIKNANDTQSQNDKNRLENDIHKFSKTPNVSDESFASNASGVAMQYKLMGTEHQASIKERKFKRGLQARIELLLQYLQLTQDTNIDWRAIEINFTRNVPVDEVSLVAFINSLRGLISNQTLISWLPQIEDPSEEIQRLADEKVQTPIFDFQV